ncbi:hypothetical protein [Peristeroidobacter soli]|uniref:hypothetical protein n=1 Tax=Peristeroidobacter soli TaxID=2497877 RepID=UPI00101CDBCD|nr:hypothetical protein [Peristeroidobacter soli]
MTRFRVVFFVVFSLMLAISVQAQTRAVIKANTEGNRAYDAARYELAVEKYQNALGLAEKAGDAQYRAIATYGLARSNAQLCRTAEADALFRESISMRASIPEDPNKAYLTQNWIEFGRFLVATKRPAEAVTYFAKAMPRLESLGIEQTDPVAYADFLWIYAAASRASADVETAKSLELKSIELRARHPGQVPRFKPVSYREDCGE